MVTFRGGVHIQSHKSLTRDQEIRVLPAPSRVIIPLSQHTGSPAKPLVKAGDTVKTGDLLAQATGLISSAVHASISGTVKKIEQYAHPVLGRQAAVIIESDGLDTPTAAIQREDKLHSLDTQVLLAAVRDAGVVGMGGAAFPAAVKLAPPHRVDTLIINGAECEPYLTGDYRLMLERTDDVLKGILLLQKILDVPQTYIGIENDKSAAIRCIGEHIAAMNAAISVVRLQTKYPQGGEKQLINAVAGREVPAGRLPFDAGVVVCNVATAVAVFEAVYWKKPVYERVVTVTGRIVRAPANLLVRIGTLFSELIEQCGGLREPAAKIIMGGPMMGIAQYSLDVPVIKGTSGILALGAGESALAPEQACIRCGRCVDVCPVNLLPYAMSLCWQARKEEQAREYNPADCMECGSCTYVCPAKRRLSECIRFLKTVVK